MMNIINSQILYFSSCTRYIENSVPFQRQDVGCSKNYRKEEKVTPCKVLIQESLGFRIPCCGFLFPCLWILDSTSTDSGFHNQQPGLWITIIMVGFWISLAGFRIPKPWIPGSTDQNYMDSGFRITLHGAKKAYKNSMKSNYLMIPLYIPSFWLNFGKVCLLLHFLQVVVDFLGVLYYKLNNIGNFLKPALKNASQILLNLK